MHGGLAQMTKMSTVPIYGKNFENFCLFEAIVAYDIKVYSCNQLKDFYKYKWSSHLLTMVLGSSD